MKQRKIRGHNRIHKKIEAWRLESLKINLEFLKVNKRDRVNISVQPWCDLSMVNSSFVEPYGKTRQKIINALLDIYESWEKQLQALNEPFYLKIWLYETRFSRSQVVCAIDDSIDDYENTFYKPREDKPFPLEHYRTLESKLANLIWEYGLDEDHHDNTEVGEPQLYHSLKDYHETKVWFEKLLKKSHRLHKFDQPMGDVTTSYSFKRGNVWLGSSK